MNVRNKLECVVLGKPFKLNQMLVGKPGAYPRVERLKGASLW